MDKLTDDEIMVLLFLVNNHMGGDTAGQRKPSMTITHKSQNTGKAHTVDGRVLGGKLINEAVKRGVLKLPDCFEPFDS